MKRFACLVNQSRRMREECEQNTLPAGTSHQAESTSISGKSATFLPPPFEEIFAKVLKKQSCLRQNLLVAAAAAPPLQKAFVAKSAPSE